MVARSYFPSVIQSPVNCGAVAMLAGLIIVPVVSWITPKLGIEDVDSMFECYKKEVVVQAKESLGN